MTHFELSTSLHCLLDTTPHKELVENVEITPKFFGKKRPLSLFQSLTPTQSYLTSLYTAYSLYAIEELSKKQHPLAPLGVKVLGMFGKMILFFRGGCVVTVGNHLISTNFYPTNFGKDLSHWLPTLVQHYPEQWLVVRNLERNKDNHLIGKLEAQGWVMWPARIVYLFPYATLSLRKKRSDYKKDQTLLKKSLLTRCEEGFTMEDFEVMSHLYRNVYLSKHSYYNAHYTPLYFQSCFIVGIYRFVAYRDTSGKIVAFVAILSAEGVLSTPALGYDTSLPSEWGLYRLVCATLLKQGEEEEKDVNFSSGADEFKQRRGGVGTLEYTAIYTRHLPFSIRLFVKLIGAITRPIARHIEKRMTLQKP